MTQAIKWLILIPHHSFHCIKSLCYLICNSSIPQVIQQQIAVEIYKEPESNLAELDGINNSAPQWPKRDLRDEAMVFPHHAYSSIAAVSPITGCQEIHNTTAPSWTVKQVKHKKRPPLQRFANSIVYKDYIDLKMNGQLYCRTTHYPTLHNYRKLGQGVSKCIISDDHKVL